MTRILVTGATGRLGGNLLHQLLSRNYDVAALTIPDDPKRYKLDGLGVEVIVGDLRDPALAPTLVANVDAVIHTANILGPPAGMAHSTFFDINVNGTFHLVEAAAQRADQLSRFVHVSSDAVYPMGNQIIEPCYHPVDEQHPQRPNRLYALVKALNEKTIDAYRLSHGLQTTMIRPSGMFAGDEILKRWTVGFVTNLLSAARRRPESGLYHPDLDEAIERLKSRSEGPDQLCIPRDTLGRSWLYSPADARDVAHACICALEHPNAVGEAFNAAVPKPFCFDEVARYISEQTGASICEIEVPVRWIYWSDVTKARSLIDFRPQGDVERVFGTALAHRAGEATDVIPA